MLFYEDKVPQSTNATRGIYFNEYKILEAI